MKKLIAILAAFTGLGTGSAAQPPGLDYEQLIHLDAEDLAEGGIQAAYERLLPALKGYVGNTAEVKEVVDQRTPGYSVISRDTRYQIYGPGIPEAQSWGNATFALFDIVNRQLKDSSYRFYAINGGNDLGGMFLTDSQAKAAISQLKSKKDWPYIPTRDHPWHGQHH